MFPLRLPLVLASASPRRKQILEMLGFSFAVHPADIPETVPPDWSPERAAAELPGHLAEQKALETSRRRPGALCLGSDTVVCLGAEVLGKPADGDEAFSMLSRLSGRRHAVRTGVALAVDGALAGSATAESLVDFRAWPAAMLRAYADSQEPRDKAGAYAIQGRGAFLVERIEGCFFNVMGLPIQATLDLLRPQAR